MSRSYRKNAILKNTDKYYKKYSNRVVRRKMNNNNSFNNCNGDYKKLYDSYNINEFSIGYPNLNVWMKHQREYYDSDVDCIRDYNRYWKCK